MHRPKSYIPFLNRNQHNRQRQ